jgi:hypothetical protein
MQDANVKFTEHENQIREEEFNLGFREGQDTGRKTEFSAIKERFQAVCDEQALQVSENFAERTQKLSDKEIQCDFNSRRDAGDQEKI